MSTSSTNKAGFSLNSDTWIISDTHFGHKAIVKFCNRPENHDELMFNNWLKSVKLDDDVLHLGDVATWKSDREFWVPVLKSLPGDKYLVMGNHDKNGDAYYKRSGFKEVGQLLGVFTESDVTPEGVAYTNTVKNHGFYFDHLGKRVLFSHYPDAWNLDWDINVHGHIHNNPYSPKIDLSRDYRNVSVEVMDYKPVRLGEII